jgi:hypothetical protein
MTLSEVAMSRRQILNRVILVIGVVFLAGASALGIHHSQAKGPPVAAFKEEGKNGKYGFIDRHGNVVLEPKYDFARDFDRSGMAFVRLDDQYGYIDTSGRLQATFGSETEQTQGFTDGLIWKKREGENRWGLYDGQGRAILQPKYDDVRPFSEGFAAVNVGAQNDHGLVRGGKWGYVNRQGDLVIPVQYDFAREFSQGLARVGAGKSVKFLDKTGKVVIDITDGHPEDFSEGFAPVYNFFPGNDWRTRFIDQQGKTAFSTDGYVLEFRDGMAVVILNMGREWKERRCGYIDREGKVAITSKFVEAESFSEGLAAVRTKYTSGGPGKGDTWGYIDKTGRFHIEPIYNEVHPFSGGLARVHFGGALRYDLRSFDSSWDGGEWWLIDKNGKKLKRSYD